MLFRSDNPHYGKLHSDVAKQKMREARQKYTKEKHPRVRTVRNMDTGEVFPYMLLACEKYELDKSTLVKVCAGKRKTCGGFRWEYV